MAELFSDSVRLVPTTVELLDYEERSGADLARELGVASPPAWPPDFNGPETRAWFRDRLRSHPENVGWYSWYVISTIDGIPTLAGIAGYKGPPDPEGKVEIGYAVVPELQRLGIASSAVKALCEHAFGRGTKTIIAHTLPALTASQAVLQKPGSERLPCWLTRMKVRSGNIN